MRYIIFRTASIWLICFGTAQAQTTIDNPYAGVPAVQTVFTPDVARDLANPTRIRVVLSFKGDDWRLESARLEGGVRSSYPDQTGFIRVDLANADRQTITSIGVSDPRIVRIYEPLPATDTWTQGDRFRHTLIVPDKLTMRAHLADFPHISEGSPVPALSSQPTQEQPRANPPERTLLTGEPRRRAPIPSTTATPTFGANAFQNRQAFRELLRARQTSIRAATFPPPPHHNVRVGEGRVVLFLPDRLDGCSVRVIVAGVNPSISLATPLLDLEGHPRCSSH